MEKKAILLAANASTETIISKLNQNTTDICMLLNRDENTKDKMNKHDLDQLAMFVEIEKRINEHTTDESNKSRNLFMEELLSVREDVNKNKKEADSAIKSIKDELQEMKDAPAKELYAKKKRLYERITDKIVDRLFEFLVAVFCGIIAIALMFQ